MTQTAFEKFYRYVLEHPALQEKLRDLVDQQKFINQVVALGAEQGYRFTPEDVAMAMQANRRAWSERWLQ